MYRLSRTQQNPDPFRPMMTLHSRNNIRFQRFKRHLKGIDKSPMLRGIRLWDQIPQAVQRALTKVKFKTGLRKVRLKWSVKYLTVLIMDAAMCYDYNQLDNSDKTSSYLTSSHPHHTHTHKYFSTMNNQI